MPSLRIRSVDLEARPRTSNATPGTSRSISRRSSGNEAPCKESCAQDGEEMARARVGRRVAVEHFRQRLQCTPDWVLLRHGA
jgi:hypothetical protein